ALGLFALRATVGGTSTAARGHSGRSGRPADGPRREPHPASADHRETGERLVAIPGMKMIEPPRGPESVRDLVAHHATEVVADPVRDECLTLDAHRVHNGIPRRKHVV